MQTTGERVIFIGEFSAGVQFAHDDFYAGYLFYRVNIYRHTTPVVGHFNGLIFMQNHFNFCGKTGKGLVHAVIDNFLCEMIWACGVGVHARAELYGFKVF